MTIEKRLERLEAILDARGLDWDHPRVEEKPAKEPSLDGLPDLRTFAQPNLRWRILEQGEGVQEGDWYADASEPRRCWPPSKGAWLEVKVDSVKVGEVATSGLVFARLVSDEPAKEPEHPAGPKPDPGEGYRILSKDPPEDLQEGDEFWFQTKWYRSAWSDAYIKDQEKNLWYRRKIEAATEPKPAWEPKVGDWVRVTRPVDWKEWEHPRWECSMHEFDGRVGQIERCQGSASGIGAVFNIRIRGFVGSDGTQHYWHRNWLSPAEPPKPAQPEYREPVLPADAGKLCEFSDDDKTWRSGYLKGFDYDEHRHQGSGWRRNQNCSSDRARHRYARIKVDA